MNTQRQKSAEKGFTIVELLVCIVVGAIVTVSLTVAITSYVHTAQRGRYLNLANSYVEGKVEALRNTGYNGLALGTTNLSGELSSQLPPGRSASMTVTSPSGGIKQVALTVSYNDQGKTVSHSYTTYIGELGVGQ